MVVVSGSPAVSAPRSAIPADPTSTRAANAALGPLAANQAPMNTPGICPTTVRRHRWRRSPGPSARPRRPLTSARLAQIRSDQAAGQHRREQDEHARGDEVPSRRWSVRPGSRRRTPPLLRSAVLGREQQRGCRRGFQREVRNRRRNSVTTTATISTTPIMRPTFRRPRAAGVREQQPGADQNPGTEPMVSHRTTG